MRGIVLAFNPEEDLGVLRAEDGRRYRFAASDWREPRPPRKRDEVDFEPDQEAARDIYVLTPGPATGSVAGDTGQRVATGMARLWSFLRARPEAGLAALIIAASVLPLYTFSGVSVSLIGLGEGIARLSSALDSLRALAQPAAMATTAAGLAKALLVTFFVLFALPLLAGWLLIKVVGGHRRRRFAGIAGALALVLPIGLPLMISMIGAWLVVPAIPVGSRPAISGAVFDLGGFGVLRSFGPGVFVMAFAGIGLIAWARRGERPIERPNAHSGRERPAVTSPASDAAPSESSGAGIDRPSMASALRDAGQGDTGFDRNDPDLYGRPARRSIRAHEPEPSWRDRTIDPLEAEMAEALAGPVMEAEAGADDRAKGEARQAPDSAGALTDEDLQPEEAVGDAGRTRDLAPSDVVVPSDDFVRLDWEAPPAIDPETERTMSHIGDLVRRSSPDLNGASAFDDLAEGFDFDREPNDEPIDTANDPPPDPSRDKPGPRRREPEAESATRARSERPTEPDAEIASVTRLYERLKAERLAQLRQQRRDEDDTQPGDG